MPNPSNTLSKIKSTLILLCLLFLYEPVFAQHWFNKTFNIYDDSARQVYHIGIDFVQKRDGNVIALSMCQSKFEYDTLNYRKSYIELSTLNRTGEKIDSATYYFKGNTLSANEMLRYDSTMFFIGGNILNYAESASNTNGYDLFLMRINEYADTLWTKKYKIGSESEFVNEIIKCEDGSILLYGTTCRDSGIYSFCDFYLLKVDTNGNEIFRKTYSNSSRRYAYAGGIISINNKIIIFGSTDTSGYYPKPILFILDIHGNILTKKSFFNLLLPLEGIFSDDLVVNIDGSILLMGTILFDSLNLFNTSLMKLDKDLNLEWFRIIEGSDNSMENLIKFNQKYMMVGYRHDERTNRYYAMVTVYRDNGNKVFERTYGIPNANFTGGSMKSLSYVSDSTIWVIGNAETGKSPNSLTRSWIMTIDTFGCLSPGCAILGINDVPFTIEPLLVFPNPANDYIQLSHSVEIDTYRMFDSSARLLKMGKYENDKIDIKDLPQGLFYIHVLLKDGTQTTAKADKW